MPSQLPVDDLLGALFIGILVSTVIYGITCLQVYLYFTEFCAGDRISLKGFVAVLMILDTIHLVLLAHVGYSSTVTNFGDFEYLIQSDRIWSLDAQLGLGGFLGLCVQMFYVVRIHILGGKKIVIPAIIIPVALTQYFISLVYSIQTSSRYHIANLDAWVVFGLIFHILCDTMITASLIYYLRRRRTTFSRTNRVINMLITYILNTCLLNTIFTVACLILYALRPNSMLYVTCYFILVRLYSCSFMSTLNSRRNLQERFDVSTGGIVSLSVFGAVSSATEEGTVTSTPGGGFSLTSLASANVKVQFRNGKD